MSCAECGMTVEPDVERELMIDGDIILYSCGFASEGEPIAYSISSMKKLLQRIMDNCQVTRGNTIIALSGPDNFRDDVGTLLPYKGNRKDNKKPTNYTEMKEYLLKYWNCEVSANEEADDVMGRWLTEATPFDRVIATLDKDLSMVAGFHYNWRKDELFFVTEEQGMNHFICQLLTGDSTDNIPGLKRITGSVATKKLKERCMAPTEPLEKYQEVVKVYQEKMDLTEEEIDVRPLVEEVGHLLWMRQTGAETFLDYLGEDNG